MNGSARLRYFLRGWNWIVRQLSGWAGFAISAGVTLALGVAATAAVFSLFTRMFRHTFSVVDRHWQLSSTVEFLLAMAFVVLLAACATFAKLLLTRSTARMGATNVRSGSGASRAQTVAWVLIECVVLAALVGVAGIGFGALAMKPLTASLFRHGMKAAPVSSPLGIHPLIFATTGMLVSGVDGFHQAAQPGIARCGLEIAQGRVTMPAKSNAVVAAAYERAAPAEFYVVGRGLPVRAHAVPRAGCRSGHAKRTRHKNVLSRRPQYRNRRGRDSGVQEASCRRDWPRTQHSEHGECNSWHSDRWDKPCHHDHAS